MAPLERERITLADGVEELVRVLYDYYKGGYLVILNLKKQKEHSALVSALSTGDEVLTSGGILGKITAVSDHYVTLKIADGVEIKIQKSTVAQIVPKGSIDAA